MNTATDYVVFLIPLSSSVFFVPFAYFLLHPSGGYDSSHVPHFCSMSPEVTVITGGAKATGLRSDETPVQWGLWTWGQAEGPGSFSELLSWALKRLVLSLCVFSRKIMKCFSPKGFYNSSNNGLPCILQHIIHLRAGDCISWPPAVLSNSKTARNWVHAVVTSWDLKIGHSFPQFGFGHWGEGGKGLRPSG